MLRLLVLCLVLCAGSAFAQIPTCSGSGAGQVTVSDTLPNPIGTSPFTGTVVLKNTAQFFIGNVPFAAQACQVRVTNSTFSVSLSYPATYQVVVTPDSDQNQSWTWFFTVTAQTPNPAIIAQVVNGPLLPSPGMFVSLSSLSFAGGSKGSIIAGGTGGWGVFTPSGTCNPLIVDTTQPLGLRVGQFNAPLTCASGQVGVTQVWIGRIQQNSVNMAFEPTLNLKGPGVSCADNPGSTSTDCTITGGGGGGNGSAPYVASVSGVTSYSIPAITHGFGTAAIPVCMDNATPKNNNVDCAWARDPATGDLAISFNNPFTGTIQVSNGNGTAGATPIGTVVGVGWTSVPSWLTASVTNAASSPLLTLAPASAQASHQVLGTCGSATTFAPCSLVAGDLPSISLTGGVTGVLPIANGGTGTTTPGLVAGTNVTITGTWPNQTINSSGGGGGGGASSMSQLTDFAITRTSSTVLTISPPSTPVACGDKEYVLSTTATITLGASSAAAGSQGWVSVNCGTGTIGFDTNANFTQGNITLANVTFGASSATGFPSGSIPLFQVFAGDAVTNQWNTIASTDYRALFRAQRVNVGGSGNLTKTVDAGGNTVIDCPNCGTSTFSTSTLKFGTAVLTLGGGGGTNHTVFSWTVPAGTIGAGDCVGIDLAAHYVQSGGTTSPVYLAWGATNVQIGAVGSGDTGEFTYRVDVCNNPSVTNAQQIFIRYSINGTNNTFNASPNRTTAALDTTQAQTLAFVWNDGFGGAQTINLDEFRVTH